MAALEEWWEVHLFATAINMVVWSPMIFMGAICTDSDKRIRSSILCKYNTKDIKVKSMAFSEFEHLCQGERRGWSLKPFCFWIIPVFKYKMVHSRKAVCRVSLYQSDFGHRRVERTSKCHGNDMSSRCKNFQISTNKRPETKFCLNYWLLEKLIFFFLWYF